jgi:chemotaxis protein methyltransferase CheR
MPHLRLGRIARRRGDVAWARRELRQALELLSSEDGERVSLFGGGFQREALMGICLSELRNLGEEP